jgi:Holliday junction resolvase
MTHRANGDAFERRVKEHYEKFGWRVVRSAGSGGPVDLVCFGNHKIHLIQCKVRNYLLPKEVAELAKIQVETGFPVYLVGREDAAPYKLLFSEIAFNRVFPLDKGMKFE